MRDTRRDPTMSSTFGERTTDRAADGGAGVQRLRGVDACMPREIVLRRFACWCARRALTHADAPVHEDIVCAVEDWLDGTGSWEEVSKIRQTKIGGATGAGAVGIRMEHPPLAHSLRHFM
jgi:hypothetical protein